MIQGGKEMLAGRWQGILGRLQGRLDIQDAFDQTVIQPY